MLFGLILAIDQGTTNTKALLLTGPEYLSSLHLHRLG